MYTIEFKQSAGNYTFWSLVLAEYATLEEAQAALVRVAKHTGCETRIKQ